ncbi:hypothetical protein EBS67_13765, partial [bacterium]|nr:hypothetical protein [bacterium]
MAQEVKPGKEEVIDLGEGVKLEMVLIPAGKFKMGFTKKEVEDLKVEFQEELKKYTKKELEDFKVKFQEEFKNEFEKKLRGKEEELVEKEIEVVDLIMSIQGKQHEVTLTKPFYMGKHEVTQEQWEAVMGKNPSDIKGAKLPVTNVSWLDCKEFIKKLNDKTNGGYR